MSRNTNKPGSSNRVFATLGILGVAALALAIADRATDGSSTDTGADRDSRQDQRARSWQLGDTSVSTDDSLAEASPEGPTWRADQVIVSAAAGASLRAIASHHGSRVVQPAGRSGYGALQVPDGMSADEFLAELHSDGMVGGAMPNGIIRGASRHDDDGSRAARPSCGDFSARHADRALSYQWHLDAMQAPEAGAIDVSDIVVAVIDTGVAYEDHTDASGTYVQAASLSASEFVAPWDFVNDDAHANDDHQHGTHIASSIASWGMVDGVAAGATIMPIKVLDEHNAGTELDLVEAIHHAVDNGADVINMSLSFGLGYMPSAALLEALDRAAQAEVVMIAATGNNGADKISYPAASPLVLAVGALDASGVNTASYSNLSNRVDIMAPGGDVGADLNGDDVPDGIIAETIYPGDPSRTGLWMYAGTSQASALVAGAVVNMLAMGALPEEIAPALEWAAGRNTGRNSWYDEGRGAGPIDAASAGRVTCNAETDRFMPRDLGAAVLPYMTQNADGSLTPTARVTVRDLSGDSVRRDEVFVTLSGSQDAILTCELSRDGICTVQGAPFRPSGDGEVFIFEVNSVVDGGIIDRPKAMAFATDALEVVTAALQAVPEAQDALLGFTWQQTSDPDLGELGEGVTLVNLGTGLASSPLGFVATLDALPPADTRLSLDLDGTGLASSPLGFAGLSLYSFDGSGLASSPLGFLSFSIVTLDGSGLASSPLGFHSLDLLSTGDSLSLDGSGLASSPLGFFSQPIDLSSGSLLGGSGAGSAIEAQLSAGGWADHSQVEGTATEFGGSGLASSPLGFTSFGDANLLSF